MYVCRRFDITQFTDTCVSLLSPIGSIAGIVGWVVNVGSNFAHVTVSLLDLSLHSSFSALSSDSCVLSQPCFNYPSVAYIDRFCDPIEVVKDVIFFYVVQTIRQSLKIIFSSQFLGDPTLLALQLRTGVSDLVWRTSKCCIFLYVSSALLFLTLVICMA